MTKLQLLLTFLVCFFPLSAVLADNGSEELSQIELFWQSIKNSEATPEKMIIPIRFEEIGKNEFPVVLLYHYDHVEPLQRMLDPSLRLRHKPKFYVVLWRDGRIVWGMLETDIHRGISPRYMHSFSGIDINIVYFQSQISTEKVEILISEINKFDLWQDVREVISPFNVGSCSLFVQDGGSFSSFIVPDINWPRSVGSGCGIVAEKWGRVAKLLLDVIPEQGKEVEVIIKQTRIQDARGAVRRISFPDIVIDSAR